MKAITETQITDSNEALIVLVFDNDDERIRIGNQILNNFELKDGRRAYAIYPDEKISGEYVIKFITPFL